ncbi:ABC transporter ATP-binding protein [Oceanobacillus salinisoli]|uniref:ABC transporter ATP-binding protein n=1 Tax=Oceanobacillus salinisoli TaxID=2678611 RepID=UPI0012E2DC5F|nr:ABC transporter ATP-binding protein [Oceanobacillus salinisoli]
MNIVDIQELSFSFSRNDEPIIDRFSLSIKKGEVVGILGPSGSGKSTLLRLIAGLEMPSSGSITIAGRRVVDDRMFIQPEDRGVGMVFQDYALFPHMTVKDNIMFGLSGLPRDKRKSDLEEMLELVQMQDYKKRYPHELSGGQQQRVALARALAPRPNVLLMDEPFSNLDTDLKDEIRHDLREILQKADMTSILVTHDQKDVAAICTKQMMVPVTSRSM